jgi:chromate transporter
MSANRLSAFEVLKAFLALGLRSFGGPVAHLGYFREEFVLRRRWLDERAFAELVGLCQFLPGPASSQVGFSLGLMRAGYWGGLAAWIGFTAPSALALVLFAMGAHRLMGPVGSALLHGLRLVAVPVVMQALLGMARALTPDRKRLGIAAVAALLMLLGRGYFAQLAALALGAGLGLTLCRDVSDSNPASNLFRVSRRVGVASLSTFLLLLIVFLLLPAFGTGNAMTVFAAFYRSGALVFGGGHVVLPLLREAFVPPGWVSDDAFLAGYGAAQAIPGPLFSFAAYLGYVVNAWPRGPFGALTGLIGIFLPGVLILLGTLPFWSSMSSQVSTQAGLRGINAAVVGVLGAALYDPICKTSIGGPWDLAIVVLGTGLLIIWRVPTLLIVALTPLAAILVTTHPLALLQRLVD